MTRNLGTQKCARCGRKQPRERLHYSRSTRRYMCNDLEACTARLRKVGRKPKTEMVAA